MNSIRLRVLGTLARVEREWTASSKVVEAIRPVYEKAHGASRVKTRKKQKPARPQERLPKPPKARPLLSRLARKLKDPVTPARVDAPEDVYGERLRQAQGARALLLEVFRRAAYDWVLYKTSRRLDQRQLAEDAYVWIFVEDEDHPNWQTRKENDKELLSFLSICEQLDLDPAVLRRHVKTLTPNKVMSSGRPPENSRVMAHAPAVEVHANLPDSRGSFDFDVLINHLLDLD